MANKKARLRKQRLHNLPPKTWNLTELLYAFVGVLTQRKNPLTFSSHHDCAPIAELVAAFIKENKLPATRPDYPKVKWPKGTDHLSNRGAASDTMKAPPPMEPETAMKQIAATLYQLDKKRQDIVLASVLEQVKKWRQDRLNIARTMEIGAQKDAQIAQEDMFRLENVIRGDFAILYPAKNAAND